MNESWPFIGYSMSSSDHGRLAWLAANGGRQADFAAPRLKRHVGQALPLARALGLTEVLLTCNETNAASIRVIERNGGVLRATKALAANRPLKRYYWINLATSS
jgi:predicted acetyltransferase